MKKVKMMLQNDVKNANKCKKSSDYYKKCKKSYEDYKCYLEYLKLKKVFY